MSAWLRELHRLLRSGEPRPLSVWGPQIKAYMALFHRHDCENMPVMPGFPRNPRHWNGGPR